MNNKRLEMMLSEVVAEGLGDGIYILDCFMGRQVRTDYSHAITTRTATDSNTFVMQINERRD